MAKRLILNGHHAGRVDEGPIKDMIQIPEYPAMSSASYFNIAQMSQFLDVTPSYKIWTYRCMFISVQHQIAFYGDASHPVDALHDFCLRFTEDAEMTEALEKLK